MKLARLGLLLCLATAGIAGAAAAQSKAPDDFSSLTPAPHKNRQYVTYDSEQQIVAAGKPAVLELRFRVVDGFHINSHLPQSDLQMPTQIALTPVGGVSVGRPAYPAGTLFSFSFSPGDKLDVYQGEFIVRIPVTAAAGTYQLAGVLHYQACDHAACYPPKALPIGIVLLAK